MNGDYILKEKARISPDDRGFYFADGVYEVIKYYKGKSFCLGDHLARLKRSLSAVRINSVNDGVIEGICDRLILLNEMHDQYAAVYIQVTRGAYPRMHRFPVPATEPTIYAATFPMPFQAAEVKNGISVITTDDIRWKRCNIKAISLLANVLTFQEAYEAGAKECFYVRDGFFTECSHSNILAVKDGMVYTYPDSDYILPGITKLIILRICSELNIKVREEPVKAADVDKYDEFLITGTGSEVLPVVSIDGRPVRNGLPGKYTRILQKAFFELTYTRLAGEKIEID